jgi:hypothetical protein
LSATNVVLWLAGIALMGVGYTRFRVPWARYQGLRAQQANLDRYEAWRGGLRTHDDGPTGASVMMADARRQAQIAGVVVIAGIVVFALGFVVR